MKSLVNGLFHGLLISILASTVVWAQSTAQVSGTVADPSGAVLPGVEVTVTQTGTGLTRSVVTNDSRHLSYFCAYATPPAAPVMTMA